MKNLNVHDLVKILQLDPNTQENLRKNYESYSEGLKYDLLSILWDGVHELKKKLADLKYEQYMQEVDQGKRELTSNLYPLAVQAVWKDFEDILSGYNKIAETDQIREVREKLQSSLSQLPTTSKLH